MRNAIFALLLGLGITIPQVAHAQARFEPLPAGDDYARADWMVARKGNHGRPEVIRALQLVAHVWKHDHPEGPTLQYNDLSLPKGGVYVYGGKRRHEEHREGLDVDVVTNKPYITNVYFKDQKLTAQLARLFKRYGASYLYYNGRYVRETLDYVYHAKGHADHFHVHFDPKKCPREILPEDRARGVTDFVFKPVEVGVGAGGTAKPGSETERREREELSATSSDRRAPVRATPNGARADEAPAATDEDDDATTSPADERAADAARWKRAKRKNELGEGLSGPQVRELQQLLKKVGYPELDVDGDFGPKTEAAVKDFQEKQKIKKDGIVGQETWYRLFKATGQ